MIKRSPPDNGQHAVAPSSSSVARATMEDLSKYRGCRGSQWGSRIGLGRGGREREREREGVRRALHVQDLSLYFVKMPFSPPV